MGSASWPDNSGLMPGYLASAYGVSPSNPDNSAAYQSLLNTIRGTTRGGRIIYEAAPYNFGSAISDPGGGPVENAGSGAGLTYIQTTGGLLTTGNLFTPKRFFHMFDLTLGSTAQRSGGAFARLVGDMLIGDIPSVPLQAYQFGNVGMENGYEGVQLVDGAGSKGVCGFFWDGMFNHVRGFAAGGCPFVINSPNGVVNTILNVIHSETAGVAAGSRPRATVHMTGAADFRMSRVENVYTVRGLIMDPGAGGRVATVFMADCIWGQNTSESVQVIPNATADCHSLEFNGGYVDTGGVSIVGAAAKAIVMNQVTFLGNSPNDALKLDGVVAGFTGNGLNFSGANAKCIHLLNNARNVFITGQFGNAFAGNTVGVHVEAGCNKYWIQMVGSEYCTTPKTEPTPGATSHLEIY